MKIKTSIGLTGWYTGMYNAERNTVNWTDNYGVEHGSICVGLDTEMPMTRAVIHYTVGIFVLCGLTEFKTFTLDQDDDEQTPFQCKNISKKILNNPQVIYYLSYSLLQ
jgi:hypothetical protein